MSLSKEKESLRDMVLANLDSFVNEHFSNMTGQKIKLTSYQHTFISDVLERKYNRYILVSSTRTGKTEANAILAVLVAILWEGEEVINVAPKFKQAEIMFKRIKGYFLNDSRLREYVDESRGFRRDEINLINGSVLRCLSASVEREGESLLGFGATTLLVDEAASIPDEVFKTRVIRMTAASKVTGRRPITILIGTPHRMNHFYESWMSDDFKKYRVTWEDGVREGILDSNEVEFYRKRLSGEEFDVWFNAEFSSGKNTLFDRKIVKMSMVNDRETMPLDGYDYYMGLDIARYGSDESSIVVLKVRSGVPFEDASIDMVFESCKRKSGVDETLGWIKENVLDWNPRLIAVDEIGLGSAVYDLLRESFGDKIIGVKMMGNERVNVYMNLVHMLESKKLTLLADSDKLEYQFNSYSLKFSSDGKKRISKNASMQDDLADSLALATSLVRAEQDMVYTLNEEMMRTLDSTLGNVSSIDIGI